MLFIYRSVALTAAAGVTPAAVTHPCDRQLFGSRAFRQIHSGSHFKNIHSFWLSAQNSLIGLTTASYYSGATRFANRLERDLARDARLQESSTSDININSECARGARSRHVISNPLHIFDYVINY